MFVPFWIALFTTSCLANVLGLNISSAFNNAKNWLLMLVIVQVTLGILTVISSTSIVAGEFGVFEWLAELHQLTGMLLLLCMLTVLYILKPSAR